LFTSLVNSSQAYWMPLSEWRRSHCY